MGDPPAEFLNVISNMISFQQKIMSHLKKQESMTHPQQGKSNRYCFEVEEMMELAKTSRHYIAYMFKELTETMLTELKEGMKIILIRETLHSEDIKIIKI